MIDITIPFYGFVGGTITLGVIYEYIINGEFTSSIELLPIGVIFLFMMVMYAIGKYGNYNFKR